MIRGTTATFKFDLPHELQHIIYANVVFWQEGYSGTSFNKLPITLTLRPASELADDDPRRTSKELVVVLTEAQTKAFTDKLKARVQLKAMNEEYVDANGDTVRMGTFGSHPQLFTVYPMSDGIIDGDFPEEGTTTNDGYIILNGGNIVTVAGEGES